MKKDGSDSASTYRKKTAQIRGCEKCGLDHTWRSASELRKLPVPKYRSKDRPWYGQTETTKASLVAVALGGYLLVSTSIMIMFFRPSLR